MTAATIAIGPVGRDEHDPAHRPARTRAAGIHHESWSGQPFAVRASRFRPASSPERAADAGRVAAHGRGEHHASGRGVPLPTYAHPGDAGADLVTTVDVTLAPGERALVPTGHRDRAAGRLRRVRAPALRARPDARPVDRQHAGHDRRRLPRRDRRCCWSTTTAREPIAADARRPHRPARRPAGRAGGVRRGRASCPSPARCRRIRFDRRSRDRRCPGRTPDGRARRKKQRPRRTSSHRSKTRTSRSTSRARAGRGTPARRTSRRARLRRSSALCSSAGERGFELRLPGRRRAGHDRLGRCWSPRTPALELRAFADARSGGLWDEVRDDLLAEADRLGGTRPRRSTGRSARAPHPGAGRRSRRRGGLPAQPHRRRRGPAVDAPGTFLGQAGARARATRACSMSALRDVIVVRGNGARIARR